MLARLPQFDSQARLLILSGIVTSTGSPPEVQQRAAALFLDWVKTLPQEGAKGPYDLSHLLQDLIDIVGDSRQSNRVIVPAINTLAAMLESDKISPLIQEIVLHFLQVTATGIERKSRVKSKREAAQRL